MLTYNEEHLNWYNDKALNLKLQINNLILQSGWVQHNHTKWNQVFVNKMEKCLLWLM